MCLTKRLNMCFIVTFLSSSGTASREHLVNDTVKMKRDFVCLRYRHNDTSICHTEFAH